MTASGALLTLALPEHEGRLLAAHLDRLSSWDPSGHVRVVARGSAVGVYAAPPMRVISFVALPLREALPSEIDVSARIAEVRSGVQPGAGVTELRLPEPAVGSPGLAILPPAYENFAQAREQGDYFGAIGAFRAPAWPIKLAVVVGLALTAVSLLGLAWHDLRGALRRRASARAEAR